MADEGSNDHQAVKSEMVYLDPYVYAIGGIGTGPNDPPLNTVERYDPGNDTWTIVASMNTGRVNVGTAVVGNQIVVVRGGGGPDFAHLQPLQTSEIYDPATDAWTTLTRSSTQAAAA